ncbi:hypothetical protein L195_g038363 [Trifolium pratense]|uniref:Uncharacterized protein n=1 Tax=Trifolium pratense TaxID=57577 RepID=A0A2K3LUW8_TRIPR|nr:hypothetical protein L195_g038363 [Trifolium pratense]
MYQAVLKIRAFRSAMEEAAMEMFRQKSRQTSNNCLNQFKKWSEEREMYEAMLESRKVFVLGVKAIASFGSM